MDRQHASRGLDLLIWLTLLGACSPASQGAGYPADAPARLGQQSLWGGEPAPLPAELQAFPLDDYRSYPENLRPLLQKREIEFERCLGSLGWGPEVSFPSCNRRYAVDLALERMGWCVGQPKTGTRRPFLRCAEHPGYRPGELAARGPPYRSDEIDWRVRTRRAQDAGLDPPRPVPQRTEPSEAALQALRAPVSAEALRADPIAAFRRYPQAARPWLQRAQIEDRRCANHEDDIDPERLRACNRRYHLLVELERLGWCMPGPRRWERCSGFAFHVPGYYELQGPTYRQSYLDWAVRYRNSRPQSS